MPDSITQDAASPTTRTRPRPTEPSSSETVARTSEATHTAHFVLQGKGGVGKSLIASLIAQFLAENGRLEACYDTDPVNGSFQSIEALKAQPVSLFDGDALNVSAVDGLMEAIVRAKAEVVVDNGAASFLPLSRYLVESDAVSILAEHGVASVVHTVVTGGPNGIDTLKGLHALVQHFVPAAAVVVWINEFFGPARFDGTDFEDTAVYKDNREKIRGLVYLRKLDPKLFAPTFAEMLERRLTFSEALQGDAFGVMARPRLSRTKSDIWNQLAAVI